MSALSAVENAPDDIDIFVGQRLRAFRTARGLSLDEVGRSIGITYQQIQKYETATNRVSASALWRLAKTLKVRVVDFFPAADGEAQDALSVYSAAALSRIDDRVRPIVVGLIEAIERMERSDL